MDITADVSISRAACFLDDAQFGAEPMGYDSSTVSVSGDHQDVVVLETAVELAAPAELVLKCGVTRGYATFYRSVLSAVQVATLSGSSTRAP